MQTDPFTGQTGAFRIRWEAQEDEPASSGTFRVTVHSDVSGRPLLVAVDHRGSGQDIAYVNEDPRDFYLVIEAVHVHWSVSVEEGITTVGPTSGNR